VWRCVTALGRDERGQDLVESALLTSFFALCALAVWTGLQNVIAANHAATSSGLQSIWDPPPPSP